MAAPARFKSKAEADIYNGEDTKAARKRLPAELWHIARRKIDTMMRAERLDDLRRIPGNQLEALKRDRIGQHSMRINGQFRICFVWTDEGAIDIEITDYH